MGAGRRIDHVARGARVTDDNGVIVPELDPLAAGKDWPTDPNGQEGRRGPAAVKDARRRGEAETYPTRAAFDRAKADWDRRFRRYQDLVGRPGARDPGPEPRAPYENAAYRAGYEQREVQRQELRAERARQREAAKKASSANPGLGARGAGRVPPPASRRARARASFETLGLNEAAPLAEVKKAYRRLVLATHPDRAPEATRAALEQRMKDLNAAFTVALAAAEAEPTR
jgi:hypothetical protein